jgi:cyclic beta-1,2-glucan synthetase
MEQGRLGARTSGGLELKGHTDGRRTARALRRALEELEDTYRSLSRHAQGWRNTPPAAEWLLDNWYLAQREGQEAVRCLKRAKRLRRTGRGLDYPSALARPLVEEGGTLTAEGLEAYLEGVQRTKPLSEEELAHFIPALRGELVRRLAELCTRADWEDEGLAAALEAAFTGLRTLANANLGPLLERVSTVERTLRQDPSGAYPRMDDTTRARYRAQLCHLARRQKKSEAETARALLEQCRRAEGQARHVGWFLFRRPMGKPARIAQGGLYLAGILLPTLFFVLLLGFLLHSWAVTLLLLLPVSDIVKNVLDFLIVRLVRPRPVHRMALEDGIPEEGKTLCVIAGLLTGERSGQEYAALLERYRLANRDAGEQLLFGLLADLPDRPLPMGERERAWVERARQELETLNRKYGGGFYLFFREPTFQSADERWMGWERKRGALLELCRLLRGRRTGLKALCGDPRARKGVKFVITLDSDTALNVGAARELAGAMLHPLNQAELDRRRRVVVSGYGLLQPRVGVALDAANKSQFSRIFAGQGGVDPYGSTTSDVYHDLFDQGTYTGKGIFDVDAFLTCLEGRFPENRVLSHDLLEGSYLHAGLIGDVELTDSYPYKVTSYFARLHRWVRGDWQLLPWLGRRVRNQRGETECNPISSVARWKIFDNLRRSVSPVSTLLALLLGMCVSRGDFATAAGVAVLAAASHLLLSGAELAFRGGKGLRERYHSTIIAGFGGAILQTLVQLLFLPLQAWTCASAACTALWRQLVSHRGMLAWVTAADAEKRAGDGLLFHYRKGWPAVAAGLVAIFYSSVPAGAAAGLVWVLAPAFAWAMSRPISEHRPAAETDRAFLLHQGALIWSFFEDWLRPEDHWLPPDNVQVQPNLGAARRTSPTNIGLALLCCLAAADLEFLSRAQAADRIGHMLDTLESLPKWKGHLYNWYDTAAAVPLSPRYVSTVDGGNLCACLIALKEGLQEWGEEKLARRAEALSEGMDFALLYDKTRRLFYIGYDEDKEAFTQGWYDLMASEARQTSYLAVAKGQVEPRHWRRLSRMLVGAGDYRGMASWTGTMFEYFMPNLLLPTEPNSAMYESLAFCLREQRRRGARTGTPWGISESGFYAFDASMAYQYKAHGVQRLGLKRGLDRELVVAPYASFLALLLSPGRAAANLRRLRDMGAEGRYGLYEALDFTPDRLSRGRSVEIVASFMSHHLGMSLLAVDNVLNDGILQRRFLRDSAMGAYRELLQERIPVGAAVMKVFQREIPEKPKRFTDSGLIREETWSGCGRPACHLVSNGAYGVLCAADGWSRSQMGETALTTREGISFWLRTGGELLALKPERFRFDQGIAWTGRAGGVDFTQRLQVPERVNGELRELSLCCAGGEAVRGELVCYLEPVLAREADYLAHPAFSKLFLESAYTGGGVLFTRRPRSASEGMPAMAVCWDGENAFFDTSRESALGRGGRRALAQALERPAQSTAGAVLDPCLLLRIPLTVLPGETARLRLALAASDNGEEALEAAEQLLGQEGNLENRLLERLTVACHLTGNQTLQAFRLLEHLVFPAYPPAVEKPALWPYGISGDLPIAMLRITGQEEAQAACFWLGCHRLLTTCGYSFDLVFLLDEGGDYRRPAQGVLMDALRALHWEQRFGGRGGVHLSPPDLALERAATVWLDQLDCPYDAQGKAEQENNFTIERGAPIWETGPDGTFVFHCGSRLPPVGWSQMLTNGEIGWMTDETGVGHLWLGNARENQLTPWNNDPLAVGGPEYFYLVTDAGRRSIFADGDGLPCTVAYGPGFARWEKTWGERTLVTTAFIPREQNRRVLLLELEGPPCQLLHMNDRKAKQLYTIDRQLVLCTGIDGTAPLARAQDVKKQLGHTVMEWNRRVSALKVYTPDENLNAYLNGWALYQVIACRLMGRTSRYQNGGAYGFRDQLQDAAATLLLTGEWARRQLLKACAHQFEEGDVLHWWHEVAGEPDRGVRTSISDDLLWLPFVLCDYLEKRGDWAILEERVPFLSAPPLSEGEAERYDAPQISRETGTVYEHALRAADCVLARGTGEHGLLLMGTGDWNDGMNRVGAEGRGESVWLTWFAAVVLERFAPVCERMGERERAAALRAETARLVQAAEKAWDGAWFRRGYYDDGTALGSNTCEECRIDSIAQSWAALVPGADREKARRAVHSALEELFDRSAGVVKLLDPPFDRSGHDPGYIAGYVPGVRENGGQYTHAAVWLALACLRLNMAEEGWQVLRALLPAGHDPEIYRAEPYVLSADVYSNPAHLGRGGWSWYTGAAGWYYRTAMEDLLGFRLREGRLFLEPRLPAEWPGFTALWRMERAVLRISVRRTGTGETRLNGRRVENGVELTALEGEATLEVSL